MVNINHIMYPMRNMEVYMYRGIDLLLEPDPRGHTGELQGLAIHNTIMVLCSTGVFFYSVLLPIFVGKLNKVVLKNNLNVTQGAFK